MPGFSQWFSRPSPSFALFGYSAAFCVPVALTVMVAALGWPPFIFEHIVVLLVLIVALPWGLGPAVVTAVVSVLADDILLREPIGRPGITGARDLLDLALFASVAVIVGSLVRRAQQARSAAEHAAERERRMREDRDRLMATVTHDLATPISVLTGTVEFMRHSTASSPRDLLRLVNRLETACARATCLLRTLADAQALESNELTMELKPVDFRTIVAPIVEMMDRVSDRHPVVLAVPDEPVMVSADADRLQSVVENLLSNAIKYSPSGGSVQVAIASDATGALLQVRDHGIGVAPESRTRIFERSYRAPEAARSAPGLGLGLSIAAHVVRGHGGIIAADAAHEGGTVISVRLPLLAASPRSTPADTVETSDAKAARSLP